jgi:hypothetical protein
MIAILNALTPLGVHEFAMPAMSRRVRQVIEAASGEGR